MKSFISHGFLLPIKFGRRHKGHPHIASLLKACSWEQGAGGGEGVRRWALGVGRWGGRQRRRVIVIG